MSKIGKNIMIRRKAIGMTQEELATKMGYKSKSTINKIENGTNDIPQSKVVKFAEVLGTSVAYLMGWDELIEEKPVETANFLADMLMLNSEDKMMLEEYQSLDEPKKLQVREYIRFLKERS